MKIGYACLTIGVPGTQMKTCRKANATPERLAAIIDNNLNALEAMIDYNIRQGIAMYRISSDLIPFGSDPATNQLAWPAIFRGHFQRLAAKIQASGMRVSMHPGQYTVLNSPNAAVVDRAIADLEYHAEIMAALEVDASHKIILHIGGVYGDKPAATARFITAYQQLSPRVKARLIIENDDRLYTIADVLELSAATGAPVVYDNLHNACNPSDPAQTDADWIRLAQATWQAVDGPAKVHYSQQRVPGRLGAHTSTIYLQPFMAYFEAVAPLDVDIMLEVKDKNLSAVKCLLATSPQPQIKHLEQEWGRYKYSILMHSPNHYQAIRQLLKDKTSYPVLAFYQLIEEALDTVPTPNVQRNAVDHIWGYFKTNATTHEKAQFSKLKAQWLDGEISLNRIKSWLKRLAVKYDQQYLLQSLVFEID